jgi:hypothetical protein
MAEAALIYELLFPNVPVVYLFLQKMVGLHFGRLVHKQIWSPCTQGIHD